LRVELPKFYAHVSLLESLTNDVIWYICSLQLRSHPVAVVQYTFTHKQYVERHKANNT